MRKLIWSSRALDDLDGACDYIARDSPKYACVLAERVIALGEKILQQPYLGAVVPEYRREELRERHVQNYRVVYRVSADRVEIVAVVHGARLMPLDLLAEKGL